MTVLLIRPQTHTSSDIQGKFPAEQKLLLLIFFIQRKTGLIANHLLKIENFHIIIQQNQVLNCLQYILNGRKLLPECKSGEQTEARLHCLPR